MSEQDDMRDEMPESIVEVERIVEAERRYWKLIDELVKDAELDYDPRRTVHRVRSNVEQAQAEAMVKVNQSLELISQNLVRIAESLAGIEFNLSLDKKPDEEPEMARNVIIANDLPYVGPDLIIDPKLALKHAIAFDVADWAETRMMAWIYGIVVGWDDEDPMEGESGRESMDEVAARFGWSESLVQRLRDLHRRFEEL